jgi:C-type mannose receptor
MCAQKAKRLGYRCFAVQYNSQCFTSRNACSTYARYGRTSGCRNGRGGTWRQNVYRVY